MSALEQFEISFFNLQDGLHDFDFTIEDAFFQSFENSIVEKGSGQCQVTLDKKSNLLTFDISLEISVELVCDRSLKEFQFPIVSQKQLVVKFGEEEMEVADDILMIKSDARTINLSQVIYEYISVEIPMKKIHPDYLRDNEDEFGEIIYKSEEGQSKDEIDPRWNALKNLN